MFARERSRGNLHEARRRTGLSRVNIHEARRGTEQSRGAMEDRIVARERSQGATFGATVHKRTSEHREVVYKLLPSTWFHKWTKFSANWSSKYIHIQVQFSCHGSFCYSQWSCTVNIVLQSWHQMSGHFIGASLSEPHTSVIYGTTCIDRPTDRLTDRVRPIHVILINCMCTVMWTVQWIVVTATRLRTPTMGKRKPETLAQQTVRLERETSEPLHTSTCRCRHESLGFFTQAFFTLSYISTCTLHSGLTHT